MALGKPTQQFRPHPRTLQALHRHNDPTNQKPCVLTARVGLLTCDSLPAWCWRKSCCICLFEPRMRMISAGLLMWPPMLGATQGLGGMSMGIQRCSIASAICVTHKACMRPGKVCNIDKQQMRVIRNLEKMQDSPQDRIELCTVAPATCAGYKQAQSNGATSCNTTPPYL